MRSAVFLAMHGTMHITGDCFADMSGLKPSIHACTRLPGRVNFPCNLKVSTPCSQAKPPLTERLNYALSWGVLEVRITIPLNFARIWKLVGIHQSPYSKG